MFPRDIISQSSRGPQLRQLINQWSKTNIYIPPRIAAVWEGRGGIGKKKGKKKEKQRKRVSAEWVYIGFYRWNHRRTRSVDIPVGDSTGGSVTSLYGYLDLNPSVIPSVKSSEKIHVITLLQLSKKTVSFVSDTVGIYRRYLLVNTNKF